jgi:nucleoside-diphosphate-sugar epimerase
MSATIAITGAPSFAASPLLHALLRREPRRVVLCDSLDGLAELQAQLLPWCEQQGVTTELRWWSLETAAALPDLRCIQWLIHGDTVRSEALLQANSCWHLCRRAV